MAHDSHDHAGHTAGRHHTHAHSHAHGPANYGRAFAIGVALNLSFVLAEVVFGMIGHSLAFGVIAIGVWGSPERKARLTPCPKLLSDFVRSRLVRASRTAARLNGMKRAHVALARIAAGH